MTDQLLTVEQVAQEFQLTSQTIRNWIKSGALSAVKIGHVYRVRREDLDASWKPSRSWSCACVPNGSPGEIASFLDEIWAKRNGSRAKRPAQRAAKRPAKRAHANAG